MKKYEREHPAKKVVKPKGDGIYYVEKITNKRTVGKRVNLLVARFLENNLRTSEII